MYDSRQQTSGVASGLRLTNRIFYGLLGIIIGSKRPASNSEIKGTDFWSKFSVVFLCFILVACPVAYPQDEPVLKPDVPKLDNSTFKSRPQPTTEGTQPKVLTGKVEHAEKMTKKKKLFSSADKEGNDGKFFPQRGKATLDKRMLRSRSKQDMFDVQAESSIGIIGVKFVMVYGSPPIINRVFPDTPASRVGLRINDVIVAVDGIPTVGLTKEEVYGMIVGTPNTPVTVSVKRNGDYQARTMNRMDFNDITDPAVKRDYMMSM